MNQIYLGQRAFGFAMAAQTYFGKDIQDITLAEAAMLALYLRAGLPECRQGRTPYQDCQGRT